MEDFSVCIGVVNLCVIFYVNDVVIRFFRSFCLFLYIIYCILMDRINRNGRYVFVLFKFLFNCNDIWLYLEEGEEKKNYFLKVWVM